MSKIGRMVIVATFLGGTLAFYWGHRPNRHGSVQVGDEAPGFTLPGLDWDPVALAEYRRQVVVLNFWATWCPPCVEEAPSLEKLAAETQPLGIAVIGVSVDEDAQALRKFVADYHLSFPVARDPDRAVASRFGTFKFPETYIIDRDGKVAEKIIGALNWQDPRIVRFVKSLAPRVVRPAE